MYKGSKPNKEVKPLPDPDDIEQFLLEANIFSRHSHMQRNLTEILSLLEQRKSTLPMKRPENSHPFGTSSQCCKLSASSSCLSLLLSLIQGEMLVEGNLSKRRSINPSFQWQKYLSAAAPT